MNRIRTYGILTVVLVVITIITGSCSMEKKLARTFIKDHPTIDLLLFTPDVLYKFNHKGEEIEGFSDMTLARQDSALFTNSRFMQYIDDSIYLERYLNRFIDELRALGFNVYLDDAIDTFLRGRPQSYVVNIPQVQLDEYYYPLEDEEPYMDTVYYKSFNLNSVDASGWFELSKINTAKPRKTVLFSSYTASDGFEGHFLINPFSGDVQYRYKIDTLFVKDIYNLSGFAGKKDASYLFDFFLNQYIAFHLPQGVEPRYYFHWDRFHKTLEPTEEERFEILDSK